MTRPGRILLSVVPLVLAACGGPSSDVAGNLPPGDVEKGRQAFIDLQCTACHEVAGARLPAPTVVPAVGLGGRRLLPPSAERLAEDILLPSSHFAAGYPVEHIVEGGASRMPDYSKALTPEQVANLVAFLKAHYSLGPPSPTR